MHYVGVDEFDLESATNDLPSEDQQTLLQTTKPDRVVNAVWDTYSTKWFEWAPDDASIRSCYLWFNYACSSNDIERMSDPRKQTQFIEELHRHRNRSTDFTSAQLASIKRVEDTQLLEANEDEYVLKEKSKKRKYGRET